MTLAAETYLNFARVSLPYRAYTEASFSTVPDRMPLSWLDAIPFLPAPLPDGTATDRVFWLDADARAWMMRLSGVSSAHADRCVREAVASAILNTVGVPCVPVYLAEVNGVHGAIRPLVRSYGTLGFNSFLFGAAERKAAARLKVSAEVLGIPSIGPSDVMIAEDGNIVPIDLSTAFTADGDSRLAAGLDLNLWDIAEPEQHEAQATAEAFLGVPRSDWDEVLSPLLGGGHPELAEGFMVRLGSLPRSA